VQNNMEAGVLAAGLEQHGVHGASALSRWQYVVSVNHDVHLSPHPANQTTTVDIVMSIMPLIIPSH
jgi:hypothetical protein